MAAALLARQLAGAGVSAQVGSVGSHADGAFPATREAVAVMAKRGFDLSTHQSRRLEEIQVATADLVVGMTREHVREAIVLDPTAWSRSFTFKELVRRARRHPRGDEPLDQWLAALASDRQPEDLLDRLTAALVSLAWPSG